MTKRSHVAAITLVGVLSGCGGQGPSDVNYAVDALAGACADTKTVVVDCGDDKAKWRVLGKRNVGQRPPGNGDPVSGGAATTFCADFPGATVIAWSDKYTQLGDDSKRFRVVCLQPL
ncbi:hypothetical protein ACGFNU_46230 [Spirillospora sp. NPDC048911]|uniref:hypothetical protein n=1 Tax=Spirillospora sp. NPDC048911 TaxID=3364527 RepID=UPI0037162CD3